MENLKQSIIKTYNDNVNHFIKDELKPTGYFIINNDVYQLNPFANTFNFVEGDVIINLIDDHIPNFWGVPYDLQKDIIKNNCLEVLPVTTEAALKNYFEYVEISEKMISDKDLQNMVNDLIKTNQKNHKKVFKGGYDSPEYQSQVLINNNVFYDNNNYWMFDKKQKMFIQIGSDDISKMLINEYGNKFNATSIDILEYMRVSYPFFVTKTDLPKVYNEQKNNKLKLNDLKQDYENINKLIRNYF